ncbi:MAG: hypothetical protein R3B90_14230 [Planctomycetaceae bacterium]
MTATLHERLGDTIFGRDDDEPEDIVVRELTKQGKTLGVCEAATGGNLIERLLRSAAGVKQVPHVCVAAGWCSPPSLIIRISWAARVDLPVDQ